MNLVGKIFTVLILVMSVTFMTMTIMVYATHKNWKVVAQKASTDLETVKKENDTLKLEKGNLEKSYAEEKSAKQKMQANLEAQVVELDKQNKNLELEKSKNATAERDSVGAMQSTQAESKALRERVEGLEADIAKAQKDRDLHFKAMQGLTDDLNTKSNELATLKDRSRVLSDDLAKVRKILRDKGIPEAADSGKTPPPMDGLVMAVRDGGLVEISIGADSGLQKGHRLEVYRVTSSGSSYVGRIEVVETTPDHAVCKIDPKFQKSDFQNGDKVKSNLN
jgi:hypothetical protein